MPHSHRSYTQALLFLTLLGSVACSSDSKGGGGGSGGGASSYVNNGDGVCPGSTRPANDDFCFDKCTQAASCSGSGRPIDSCCVLVGEPGADPQKPHLERTTNTKEFADPTGGAPDLGCFETPPTGGASGKTATLTGEIRPFANGGCEPANLIGVKMEVFTVKRTGDPATDGALDSPVGNAIIVDDTMEIVEETVDNCTDGKRYNRKYSLANVPMYTELAIKTSGAGWTPLYAYNVYISEDDSDFSSGSYTYNARALAEDDFGTIPTVAIGQTITPGNGAIGGEVHDCKNIRLQNARVDVSLPRLALEYFNSDEDDPLPDQSRRTIGTGRTALYTALDISVEGAQGSFARVAGAGLVPDGEGSKLVSLGYYDVRVFPDAVTSVSLRGLRPFQVK